MSTTDSPRFESSSPARGMIFSFFFSTVIHFWQIWQNDLIMEKTRLCANKFSVCVPIYVFLVESNLCCLNSLQQQMELSH